MTSIPASRRRPDPRRPVTPIVVITGPPASGKSTLAAMLSERLHLPLIAKDPIKERLYDSFGTGDREWSRHLGRATYPLLYLFLGAQLGAGRPAIVDGSFGPAEANAAFADLHARWPFAALQLHCSAPADVLLERYADRAANRHPGHLDGAIIDEVRAGLEEGRWKPLDLPGRHLVRVDTTSLEALDLDGVVARAADHIGGAQRT